MHKFIIMTMYKEPKQKVRDKTETLLQIQQM